MGTSDWNVCTNAAPTVVEMDPVTPALEFAIMVVKTGGVVLNVERKKMQVCLKL